MGTDWADLRVRPGSDDAATPAPPAVDEAARIEGLLAKLEASGVTFIRNGSEHDAREAAEHLRNKWAHAPSIDTAERFIDELGTRSSSSGQPYRVRLRDGREAGRGPWLHSLLARPDAMIHGGVPVDPRRVIARPRHGRAYAARWCASGFPECRVVAVDRRVRGASRVRGAGRCAEPRRADEYGRAARRRRGSACPHGRSR
ncbi:MAG: DUF5329 family protein [Deltaproteobacteria bacterium]|nr:DUF5329 family protein [Deltaproteobacteria bacterium]